ncbi:Hypothetical predicted protein [Olea europaea subsp. europaea]|uniref:Uncharacterized protein n=1 Tax=Olea europaea subsp. europaea TaxID=158383 RepID=A0A8S0TKC2_OLEEU|nr:Hypothetical predicted protein [Olea europaea subsp. europaea]
MRLHMPRRKRKREKNSQRSRSVLMSLGGCARKPHWRECVAGPSPLRQMQISAPREVVSCALLLIVARRSATRPEEMRARRSPIVWPNSHGDEPRRRTRTRRSRLILHSRGCLASALPPPPPVKKSRPRRPASRPSANNNNKCCEADLGPKRSEPSPANANHRSIFFQVKPRVGRLTAMGPFCRSTSVVEVSTHFAFFSWLEFMLWSNPRRASERGCAPEDVRKQVLGPRERVNKFALASAGSNQPDCLADSLATRGETGRGASSAPNCENQ